MARPTRATITLAAALILASCSSLMMSGGGNYGASSDATERGATERARDSNVSAAVRTRLAGDPVVSAYAIDVRTVNGQVTLTGKVGSYDARNQAYRLARQVDGVTAVINRLSVEESSN